MKNFRGEIQRKTETLKANYAGTHKIQFLYWKMIIQMTQHVNAARNLH